MRISISICLLSIDDNSPLAFYMYVFFRSQLEQKESALRNKGVITSLAAQQQITMGNPQGVVDSARSSHLESEVREIKVRDPYISFFSV